MTFSYINYRAPWIDTNACPCGSVGFICYMNSYGDKLWRCHTHEVDYLADVRSKDRCFYKLTKDEMICMEIIES
jgi:hypothetical protein